MFVSKNFTCGLVEITDCPNGIDYEIKFPNNQLLVVSQDEWEAINSFIINSMEFIDKN